MPGKSKGGSAKRQGNAAKKAKHKRCWENSQRKKERNRKKQEEKERSKQEAR